MGLVPNPALNYVEFRADGVVMGLVPYPAWYWDGA
jgi:hypothetical protein